MLKEGGTRKMSYGHPPQQNTAWVKEGLTRLQMS